MLHPRRTPPGHSSRARFPLRRQARGELWQAAAYAYAYYKTANLPDIDSFILHRHVDHGAEGGLNLGLWTRDTKGRSHADPVAKKKIYGVFQDADTPGWKDAFEFALPVIGIQKWEKLIHTE